NLDRDGQLPDEEVAPTSDDLVLLRELLEVDSEQKAVEFANRWGFLGISETVVRPTESGEGYLWRGEKMAGQRGWLSHIEAIRSVLDLWQQAHNQAEDPGLAQTALVMANAETDGWIKEHRILGTRVDVDRIVPCFSPPNLLAVAWLQLLQLFSGGII